MGSFGEHSQLPYGTLISRMKATQHCMLGYYRSLAPGLSEEQQQIFDLICEGPGLKANPRGLKPNANFVPIMARLKSCPFAHLR